MDWREMLQQSLSAFTKAIKDRRSIFIIDVTGFLLGDWCHSTSFDHVFYDLAIPIEKVVVSTEHSSSAFEFNPEFLTVKGLGKNVCESTSFIL